MPLITVNGLTADQFRIINTKLNTIMDNQAKFQALIEAQSAYYENLKADIERQNALIEAQKAEITTLRNAVAEGGLSALQEGQALDILTNQVNLLGELSRVVPEPPAVPEEPTEDDTEDDTEGETQG